MDEITGSIYYNKKFDDKREAKLVINKDNPLNFEKYLARIPEIFAESSNLVYRNSRNTIKKFKDEFELARPVIIKKFGQHGVYDNIRFRVANSRAYRSFRAASWLDKLDVLIPRPYLAIEYRTGGNKLINSYYICEFVEFDFDLYKVYRENPLPGIKEQVIIELAKTARKIHNNGIIYGDFHPNNIHFVNDGNSFKFYLIDFNRIKKYKSLSLKQKAKDLCRLRVPDQYLDLFLSKYKPDSTEKLAKKIKRYQKRHEMFKEFKRKIRN